MAREDEVARIVESDNTVSDKIRALDGLGLPRAEIARRLGKLYQHVRNVLEADRQRGRPTPIPTPTANPGMAEEAVPFQGAATKIATLRLEIRSDGSVMLPAEVIGALGLYPGGVVISEMADDRLTLLSHDEVVRRFRAGVSQWRPGESMASDELIADRRREAALEEEEALKYGAKPLA